MTNQLFLSAISILFGLSISAQSTQNIRGVIQDSESLTTLPGATIIVKGSDPLVGTSSDVDGHFMLPDLPLGRISIVVQMVGYEDAHYDQLLLSSGKELFLEVPLNSSFTQLNEVVIKANNDNGKVLNEMATISARSFSVEETQRYAASAFDPGRMASSFAGVSNSGDNMQNMLSVRGNSPRGILWRLEGVEIPNPNHFGDLGSSGGGISMMSSSTLGTSDFYTGAFPSEFGSATSGVFDINFRNGNSEVREHSVMIGALGIEAATEGYFSKDSKASYLVNYRYSTLGALSTVYQPLGDIAPVYQDLSFKVNLPETAIGSLSFFGLGGNSYIDVEADTDTVGVDPDDLEDESFRTSQTMGVIGLKHVLKLNSSMYLKTSMAMSVNRYEDEFYEQDSLDIHVDRLYELSDFRDDQFTVHSMLNYKRDSRNTFRVGVIGTSKKFAFNYDLRDDDVWTNYLNDSGSASQFEQYAQWKHRLTERLTGHLGYHFTYLPFNETSSLEPRMALAYKTSEKSKLSLAMGLHSRPEHISTYYMDPIDAGELDRGENPNLDLEIPKSVHVVLGYETVLGKNIRTSIEAYYQYQYDLPVEGLVGSSFATQNAEGIWDILDADNLVSDGKGRNYGVDLSLAHPFQDGLYVMLNSSVFSSEYSTYDGDWFNTRFNTDYVVNLLGGKEFELRERKGKKRFFGVNGKLTSTGGLRESPIDQEASMLLDETVRIYDRTYANHAGAYLRLDLGISYKVNRPRATHTLMLDIQNVSNRENIYGRYYDSDDNPIETLYQTGLFPFINYRIEFQGKRKG